MSRYVRQSRARLWVEDEMFPGEEAMRSVPTVPEHEAVETGLLWADGAPILRAPNPIGFGGLFDG